MTNSSASSHSSFIVLKDYHLFQKHSESSSWNKDSHLMLTLKIKDEHDEKYAICLLTFCGGTGKSANNLILGVLHLIDSIKTCGHPDPIGACCTYFPHVLISEISEQLSEVYNALAVGAHLTEATFQSLIAQVFAI